MGRYNFSKKAEALIEERIEWGREWKVRNLAFHEEGPYSGASSLLFEIDWAGGLSCSVTRAGRFYFFGTEAQVIKKLKEIGKVVTNSPEKTKVKMVSSRLDKIFAEINRLNQIDLDFGRARIPLFLHFDGLTPEKMKKIASRLHDNKAKRAARDLAKILTRGDITGDILKQAWDQLQIQEVMAA